MTAMKYFFFFVLLHARSMKAMIEAFTHHPTIAQRNQIKTTAVTRTNQITTTTATRVGPAFIPKQREQQIKHAASFLSSTKIYSSSSPNEKSKDEIKGVTLKVAFDSNPTTWSVSDLSQKPERFTSPSSLDLVHRLRRKSCAVLVGCNTVIRDDCTLTVRRVKLKEGETQPTRVVVDPSLKVLKGRRKDGTLYSLLTDGYDTIIYHTLEQEEVKSIIPPAEEQNISKHVTLVNLSSHHTDKKMSSKSISPELILQNLSSQFDLHHIMVEGGPYTALNFLLSRVVDRAILIRAPIIFQDPEVSNIDCEVMKNAGLEIIGTRDSEGDMVEYWIKKGRNGKDGEEEKKWPSEELKDWP